MNVIIGNCIDLLYMVSAACCHLGTLAFLNAHVELDPLCNYKLLLGSGAHASTVNRIIFFKFFSKNICPINVSLFYIKEDDSNL